VKLLIFSDIHEDWPALETLMNQPADIYIAAGDLANWGRGLEKAAPILAKNKEKLWLLPGNHESDRAIEVFCQAQGFHNLHGASFECAGYHVAGLGCSNPTPFNTPGEYTEAELAKRLAPFSSLKPLILICHCPPKDTDLDAAGQGQQFQHFGSVAVKDFIAKEQPAYFFCGHIHESAGVHIDLGKTQAWNVGKKGYLLEI
jgi:Icc-related predicted phosphoesterase